MAGNFDNYSLGWESLQDAAVDRVEQQQQCSLQDYPQREIILRQAPTRAEVLFGDETGRKPIDPPPIVQLYDKTFDGSTMLYNSRILFVTAGLVSDTYSGNQEVLPNCLVGSLASSVYRLKDTDDVEGEFFIFDDLSVRKKGRFRLMFTLYELDHQSSNYLSHIVTDVFTVYSRELFPGLTESTPLARKFREQGVKVPIRPVGEKEE